MTEAASQSSPVHTANVVVEGPSSWAEDLAAGCLVAAIGLSTIVIGQSYGIGTARQMGPGFFPLALGVILAGLGTAMSAGALRDRKRAEAGQDRPAWGPDVRGTIFIVAAVLSFLVLGEMGGLIPASFACVFLSALADRGMRLWRAALFALCLTLLGTVLFSLILKVRMPMLNGWTA